MYIEEWETGTGNGVFGYYQGRGWIIIFEIHARLFLLFLGYAGTRPGEEKGE